MAAKCRRPLHPRPPRPDTTATPLRPDIVAIAPRLDITATAPTHPHRALRRPHFGEHRRLRLVACSELPPPSPPHPMAAIPRITVTDADLPTSRSHPPLTRPHPLSLSSSSLPTLSDTTPRPHLPTLRRRAPPRSHTAVRLPPIHPPTRPLH